RGAAAGQIDHRGAAARHGRQLLAHRREEGAMSDERRAFQRLNLTQPVDGAFGGVPLRIVEVSARGVLAMTDAQLQRWARGVVRFDWRGERVEAGAAVAWCEEGRAGFRLDEVPDVLRRLIEDSVTELLEAQEVRDYTPNVVG